MQPTLKIHKQVIARVFSTYAIGLPLFVFVAAAAGEAGKEKPADFALVNKAKDIRVISERDEPIQDFFQHNRILIGGVLPEALDKVLRAREPLPKFFVSYASQNDDAKKASTFGATLEIAPPTQAVTRLLQERRTKMTLTLILRRNDRKPGLYHVVGCTERTPVGFFDNDKKNATDGFTQKELCYKSEAKAEPKK